MTLNKKHIPQETLDRLGSDCRFPIDSNFESIEGIDTLIQDIQLLILTLPGERVGRPNWGCTLRNLIWENIDDAYVKGIASIRAALNKYEPRITVTSIDGVINRNTDLITYRISFIVKSTNISANLVIPFRTSSEISSQ